MSKASLPAIGKLLQAPETQELLFSYGAIPVRNALRTVLSRWRTSLSQIETEQVTTEAFDRSPKRALIEAQELLRREETLMPVINATGVLLHTNAGRAPMGRTVLADVEALARYCSLEVDLNSGERSSRHVHARRWLTSLTDAEDAVVVNNAAAALLLALSSLASNTAVIVSRGELIEIGGSFRIPEIITQGGATLYEVGTTNRTRLQDYQNASLECQRQGKIPLVLKVHRSNFAILGFTQEVSLHELVTWAHSETPPLRVVYDQGSGLMVPGNKVSLSDEPDVPSAVRTGVDVTVFSGDKLLGGPQAGILVGRKDAMERMKKHPLMRALRPGKLVLSALESTLKAYVRHRECEEIPLMQFLQQSLQTLEERAIKLKNSLALGEVKPSVARIGAGAQPIREIPSVALYVSAPDGKILALWAKTLRIQKPFVLTRIEQDQLIFDMRTVFEDELSMLKDAIERAILKKLSQV